MGIEGLVPYQQMLKRLVYPNLQEAEEKEQDTEYSLDEDFGKELKTKKQLKKPSVLELLLNVLRKSVKFQQEQLNSQFVHYQRRKTMLCVARQVHPGLEGPAASCELANKCNHTWQPVCGQQQHELTKRLFIDECDMHEYNCDNKISYIKVTLKTCAYKCTRSELNTPKFKPPASITTDTTDTETTTAQSSTTDTGLTTTHATTLSSTTKTKTTTTNSAETSSENNFISEDPVTITPTSLEPVSTVITTTVSTTTTPTTTNESTIIETTKVTSNEIETDEETTTEPQTSAYTKKSTTGILRNCTDMDKDCLVPSTWETTHATETRDFYQIIRERFGDKVKFLKHTTHFARRYK
ncbi:unnamed protein product [Arctia plantaginis]|nr:unnamed protein product [Arctia plantaginis]